jgi:hypothetical protein
MMKPASSAAVSLGCRAGAVVVLALATLGASGCARIMANRAAPMMVGMAPVIETEGDPVIAEVATLSNLKMVEGLLLASPENETLLMTMTKAFAGYGAAFVEPEQSLRDDYFSEDYLFTQRRLQGLYRRSLDLGLRWIDVRRPELASLLRAQVKNEWVDELPQVLVRVREDDVPALFWTAQAWGLLIRADDENLLELANMAKVEAMMRRVYGLDPDYSFGAVHLFFAIRNTTLGQELGGDLDVARQHFEAAIAVTDGRFLPARFFYARDYCRAIQDRECFESGLEEVAEADPDIFPEQRLANTLATEWARQWLSKVDDLF